MSTPDLIDLFVAPLNRLGIEYMVSGAVAAIIYGEPRLTNDIDIVASLSAADLLRVGSTFDAAGFHMPPIDVMEEERRRPRHGHFNIVHVGSSLKADIYPSGSDPLQEWGLAHRRALAIADETIWTAPPEYVILLKLEYWRDGGSDKHPQDIRAMLRVMGPELDRRLIAAEARRRGLLEQWELVER